MSMEFSRLIDKEDIILDSQMLAEFNEKNRLNEKIDNLALEFIKNNIPSGNYEKINLIYAFAEKIKDII